MEEKTLNLIRTAVSLTVSMLYWPAPHHMTKREMEKALRQLLDCVGDSWLPEHPDLVVAGEGKVSLTWRGQTYWFSRGDISALAYRCIPPREAYLCLHD